MKANILFTVQQGATKTRTCRLHMGQSKKQNLRLFTDIIIIRGLLIDLTITKTPIRWLNSVSNQDKIYRSRTRCIRSVLNEPVRRNDQPPPLYYSTDSRRRSCISAVAVSASKPPKRWKRIRPCLSRIAISGVPRVRNSFIVCGVGSLPWCRSTPTR